MRKLYLGNGDKQFKFADTTTEINLNAFDDGSAAVLTADAKVRIKNDSGYLLGISASITDNHAVITSGQLAQLPIGSYLIELWDTVNGGTAIYPSEGFLALQINDNVTGLSGGLVSSITVDDFIRQFSDLSKQLKQEVSVAVANGLKGDKGDDGLSAYQIAVINGYHGSQAEWLASLIGAKGDKGDPGNYVPETFTNLSAIKSKYPNGANGVMVAADNGHKYIWSNNVWTDAGVYQSVGIADGSVTIDKLAANAQQPIFTPSGDGLPNYDTATQTLDFNCITDQAFFQVGNKIIQLPKNLVVKSSVSTSSSKLIFNIVTNEFSFVSWGIVPATSEMIIGTLRRGKSTPGAYYWQGTFDITIDGRQWNQSDIPARTIFTPGSDNKPDFNTKTKQFDFGSTTTTTPTIQMGAKTISIPNGTIAYPTEVAMNVNTLRVVYNVYNSTAQVVGWNEVLPPNTVVVCLVVANYQDHPFISGGFPYTIDGVDPNLPRNNAYYVTSLDGVPTFDVKTKTLDLNCYTDQGYFEYNGKSYQVPKETKIVATETSSTNFTFSPSDMTFHTHAYSDPIPVGEVLFLSIRIGNKNNQTVATGTFPVDIIGQSFKSNSTDNPIDAKIKGINHRGFNTVAPEESKSAYLLSKRNGYHHWEGDINFTKDNVPMMIHDLAINRTARNLDGTELSSTVNLTDLNYADLAKYDFGIVKGDRYKGELLLSFEELVKLARYNDAFLHIEFKYAFTQEQVQILHNITVKYNMLDRIGWQAFGWDNLKSMMALEPNGQYELLGGDVTDDYFTKMAALKTDANTIIASQSASLSVADIQKIADKGYPIYLWTVDDGETVRKFRDVGMVEGIMTNGAINVADELAK